MRGYIANTDFDWFTFLAAIEPPIDEVNFWRPGSDANFKALQPGEPFFFRLKAPRNAIGGFGYFAHFTRLPTLLAWDIYGQANGAPTYVELRQRLIRLRSRNDIRGREPGDFQIGCILINAPVFFRESEWVRMPADYKPGIQQGKTYDLTSGEGHRIWMECLGRTGARTASHELTPALAATSIADRPIPAGYGEPTIIRPRLGQRSFRVVVLDCYGRRCAVTSERTLPALEAAHIRDYRDVEEHSINNGILFRADIHNLFDTGYVTVTPDYHFEVSKRIKEEFENGRDYYKLDGSEIRLPEKLIHHPAVEALRWHNENRYLG